jgi:ribosome-binding protein aMBF1 (putative translation factor)
MVDRQGSRTDDGFAATREDVAERAQAEKELGSRWVVARNVMRLRTQHGYTQQRLARELGVKQPRVAEIESAGTNLRLDTVDRLAAALGVEPARLLQPDSPSAAPERTGEPLPSAESVQ